jgi:Ankyrin repeats (3 copies)
MIEHVPRIGSSVALNEEGKRAASSEPESQEPGQRDAKKSKRIHLVIKPSDYAMAAFRANGVDINEARTRLTAKFSAIPICAEQIDGYKAEVLDAIKKGDISKLKELDAAKTLNVDACNRWGESLLHMACRRSHTEVVVFLLNKGANVNIRDDYHRTPLHDAAWTTTPNFKLVDTLLKHGAGFQVLMQDVRGFTPFDYVRHEHWGQWLRFLWERKATLTTELDGGRANE